MRHRIVAIGSILAVALSACTSTAVGSKRLASQIRSDSDLRLVLSRAEALVDGGLTAGRSYPAVFIRDLNTFVDLYLRSHGPPQPVRQALLTFLDFQQPDGGIPDGYESTASVANAPGFLHSPLHPEAVAFKATTETDQESSLIQAVTRYIAATGDTSFLDATVSGHTVRSRLVSALHSLFAVRLDPTHGLLWGGTTVDWGDIQAGGTQATIIGGGSHRAIGIYENAMFSLALQDLASLPGTPAPLKSYWQQQRTTLDLNINRWLWDSTARKYRAHLYLDGSPFPPGFDESRVFLQGGTTVAIEAGLLSDNEIHASLTHMDADVAAARARSIGLSVYPPYPASSFSGSLTDVVLMAPYSYQNGGTWDWFGARMVQALVAHSDPADAYREIKPMVEQVTRAGGFYEWWTRTGQPRGSADYRGSAGELGLAALRLLQWAGEG